MTRTQHEGTCECGASVATAALNGQAKCDDCRRAAYAEKRARECERKRIERGTGTVPRRAANKKVHEVPCHGCGGVIVTRTVSRKWCDLCGNAAWKKAEAQRAARQGAGLTERASDIAAGRAEAVCKECYDLPHRRDTDGCKRCGKPFAERKRIEAASSMGCGLATFPTA